MLGKPIRIGRLDPRDPANKVRLKPDSRAYLDSERDIREALKDRPWVALFATRNMIQDASKILIAASRQSKGTNWYELLDKPREGPAVWKAFGLLMALEIVFCEDYEDPFRQSEVKIDPKYLGRYKEIPHTT